MMLLNWGWIGIVLAALAAGFVGGCEHKQREVDALLAAGEVQNAQTAQTIIKHKQIAQEIKNDYETRIASIRSNYGLRTPRASFVPAATSTTGNSNGTPAHLILTEQCTETTQQLVSLQDFIKETR